MISTLCLGFVQDRPLLAFLSKTWRKKALLMLLLEHGGTWTHTCREGKAIMCPKVGTICSPVNVVHIPWHVLLAEAGAGDQVSLSTFQMTVPLCSLLRKWMLGHTCTTISFSVCQKEMLRLLIPRWASCLWLLNRMRDVLPPQVRCWNWLWRVVCAAWTSHQAPG